ncbi:nickel pincer cofactor biosynthesis protein LarC [candidate division WOR-3 bacterium]|nr:nickel pincer cofactor biosynthesis protein LarC [candidate division WOR-3 bacterium]
MKILYFDPIPGASGDMILAALIDCGVPRKHLVDRLSFVPGFTMTVKRLIQNGVSARQVRFKIRREVNERQFLPLIKKSDLSGRVKEQSIAILERIFDAERRVHRAKHLHLHELADADTLLDICGALVAIEYLAVDKIYSRALKAGTGFIRTVEGTMPSFNFATAYLSKDFPVEFMPIASELTTPTGAAIISTIATPTDSIAISRIEHIGMGAGTMTLKDHPNLMRVFIGTMDTCLIDTCTVYETNIDDMNPQDYESVVENLYRAGALEVMMTPTFMKKTRPGILITVICQNNHLAIRDILLSQTTTLGIRMHETKRWKLRRTIKQVSTPLGKVRVKIAWIGTEMRFSIEYKDIERIARMRRRSIPKMRTELTHLVAAQLAKSAKS